MWHVIIITLVGVPLWSKLGEKGYGLYPSMAIGMGIVILLTALMSWLSFTLIESPFLALRPTYVVSATRLRVNPSETESNLSAQRGEMHAPSNVPKPRSGSEGTMVHPGSTARVL